ncbi:MAG: 3-deoxy-7-phosphoheptulonate synthase, partial [Planctomycetota bacterium]|nr:3-deoxy-7-phosphoheptulonate synthase [Planctomycetota bacterium]
GVAQAIPVTKPYKLVLREIRDCDTVVEVATSSAAVAIGSQRIAIAAGPCAVEDRAMLLETAQAVKAAGATILRGGAFKPRTSPYSFQGLGAEALGYLAEARAATGLAIVTEAVD